MKHVKAKTDTLAQDMQDNARAEDLIARRQRESLEAERRGEFMIPPICNGPPSVPREHGIGLRFRFPQRNLED